MNTQLLEEVKQRILAEPAKFNMAEFIGTRFDMYPMSEIARTLKLPKHHICGTAACIGGWAVILTRDHKQIMEDMNWLKDAQEALDLELSQAQILFFTASWPIQFKERYYEALGIGMRVQAKIAADRIDHFIATNGKE